MQGRSPCDGVLKHLLVLACLGMSLALPGACQPAGERVVQRWDFEDGPQGWVKWSTVPMVQEARAGDAQNCLQDRLNVGKVILTT